MLAKIKSGSQRIKGGEWTLADFYNDLAVFFDSLEPSTGVDVVEVRGVKHGGYFNFKRDAEELRMLAKKEKK